MATILVDGLDVHGLREMEPQVEAAAQAALDGQTLVSPEDAEVSIAFVGDGEIGRLNEEWLGTDGPTDVISFGLGEAPLVADVYISVDTARRNAARFGVEPREELLRLVVHGVLHAAGYDHPEGEDREASEMFVLQERLLERLLNRPPEG
ncbi:MAG: rRNA maturation RNase YbeY [Gemmatimonadota bacterium]